MTQEEIEFEPWEKPAERTPIIVDRIEGITAIDRIKDHLKKGRIVFAKLEMLKDSDDFKNIVIKFKTFCSGIGGDMVIVGKDWIILTTNAAEVSREAISQ